MGYLIEVMGSRPLRDRFLEWDDDSLEFTNLENLYLFLSWILPDEGSRAKIINTRDIRKLASMYRHHPDAFELFKDSELTVNEAERQVPRPFDWETPLKKAKEALEQIPMSAIENLADEQKALIQALVYIGEKRLSQAEKLAVP